MGKHRKRRKSRRPSWRQAEDREACYLWRTGTVSASRIRKILRETRAGARITVEAFPRSNGYLPGTWKGLRASGKRSASFTCPRCGKIASLIRHTVRDDGTVEPSVVCPAKGCLFHAFIRLIGWEEQTH